MNLVFSIVLVSGLIVLARSDQSNQENSNGTPVICDSPECLYCKGRLDTLEAVVQKIATILLSQTSPVFVPVSRMLENDPTVKLILSQSAQVAPNSTTSATEISQSAGKETTVGNLIKGSLKCSLANLVDIKTIGNRRNSASESALIAVLFTDNDSLEIEWSFPSVECIQFSSGVLIQVFQSGEDTSDPETSLFVPQKCLETTSSSSFNIFLPPPNLFFDNNQNDTCRFLLNRNLIPCRNYMIEVIPDYQSFRGSTLLYKVNVNTAQLSDESSMKSLVSVAAHSNLLMLNWEDNSGCAPQLTSFDLKIFPDGIVDGSVQENVTVRIPRSCLKGTTSGDNLFSLTLPS